MEVHRPWVFNADWAVQQVSDWYLLADATPPSSPPSLSATDTPNDSGSSIDLTWAAASDDVGAHLRLTASTAAQPAGSYGAPTTLGNVTRLRRHRRRRPAPATTTRSPPSTRPATSRLALARGRRRSRWTTWRRRLRLQALPAVGGDGAGRPDRGSANGETRPLPATDVFRDGVRVNGAPPTGTVVVISTPVRADAATYAYQACARQTPTGNASARERARSQRPR